MQSRFKKLMRKVDRIEYSNTDFPSNYEEVQEDYRIVKKKLDAVKNLFVRFMSYEHGGRAFKVTMRAIEIVGRKISPESYELKSFYRETELAAKEISKIKSNDALKTLADNYGNAYSTIEDEKIKMNDELEKVIETIKKLQEKSQKIDTDRADVLNLRYDLEKMYKKRNPEDPELSEMKSKFQSSALTTKEQMSNFIKDDTMLGVFKQSAAAQVKFFEAAASELKNIM